MVDWVSGDDPQEQLELPRQVRRRRRKIGGVRWLPSGRRIRQPGDDRAQLRVSITLPSGRPLTLSRVVDPAHIDEARAALVNEAREYRDGLKRPDTRQSLKEWARVYRRKGGNWPRSRESAFKALRDLHAVPLPALTAELVSRWARGAARRGHNPGYIRHCFDLLRVLVRSAVDHGELAALPFPSKVAGVESQAKAVKKRPPATPEQLRALFGALEGPKHAMLRLKLLLSLQSGARPHELCRARRDWLADARSLPGAPFIPGAGVLRLPPAKKGEHHEVPLPAELYRQLLEHWHALPLPAQRTGLLFPALHGKRWAEGKHWVRPRDWRHLLERAGLQPKGAERNVLVLYQCRHTRLSDVANDPRLGARKAQALAGHTDVRTTQTYMAKASVAHEAMFELSPSVRAALDAQQLPLHTTPASVEVSRAPSATEPEPEPTGGGAGGEPREQPSRTRTTYKNNHPRKTRGSRASAQAMPAADGGEMDGTTHATVVPAERERLLVLARRLLREGVVSTAAAMVHVLPPLDAAGAVHELAEQLAVGQWPELEHALLTSFVAEVRRCIFRRAGASVPVTEESSMISGARAVGSERFTRIAHAAANAPEVHETMGEK